MTPALTLPLTGGLTALARRAAPLASGGFLVLDNDLRLSAWGQGWMASWTGAPNRSLTERTLALARKTLEALGSYKDRLPALALEGGTLLAGGRPLGPAWPVPPEKALPEDYPREAGSPLAFFLWELSASQASLLARLNAKEEVALEPASSRLQASGEGWSLPAGGPPSRPTALAAAVREGPTRGSFPVGRGLLKVLDEGPLLVALQETESARLLYLMGEDTTLTLWRSAASQGALEAA